MRNINPNPKSSATQCGMIAAYLEQGNTITHLEALYLFGCFHLSSRICDLKNRGYNIGRVMVKTPTGKHIAQYFLKDETTNG